jgi:nicotinamide-nucleotide amidase
MMDKQELKSISGHLLKRDETVSVSESVTSGLLMNAFSLLDNATSFFQGGITAYNLGQKTRHLAVNPIHAEQVNCVSDAVSRQMALEVAKSFCSNWGIAVTGYAAPVPALNIKSCFAFYAFSYNGNIVSAGKLNTKLKGPFRVQQYYVRQIMLAFAAKLL